MTRYVALLRAVNVGGAGRIVMADLRAAAEMDGLASARTILQSGNLVFGSSETAKALELRIETMLASRFRLSGDVMVRDAGQWAALIAGNPFADMAAHDPSHLLSFSLKRATRVTDPPDTNGAEQVQAAGDVVYVAYPDGIGRSKLTAAKLERHYGVRGTGRNWSTVLKIAAALAE